MRLAAPTIAVLMVVLLGAGDSSPAIPKSAGAIAAIRKGDHAVYVAGKAYRAAVQQARQTEAKELKAASKQAANNNDADEIVAIAAKIKEVGKISAETSPSELGRWEFTEANGSKIVWIIKPDQVSQSRTNNVARPELDENVIIVRWPGGWKDRLTFVDDRAFWESYAPGQDMSGPANGMSAGRFAPERP